MADEKSIPLTSAEAKQLSHQASKLLRTNKKTKEPYILSEVQKTFQLDFIQKGIREAATKGRMEYSVIYDAKDEKTGRDIFSLDFFLAVARAFKDTYPGYMLIMDQGPLRKLTISWHEKNEV